MCNDPSEMIHDLMGRVDSILSERGLEKGRHEIAQILKSLRECLDSPECEKIIETGLEQIRIRHSLSSWTQDIDDAFKNYLRSDED